jgi:hypothetical protein
MARASLPSIVVAEKSVNGPCFPASRPAGRCCNLWRWPAEGHHLSPTFFKNPVPLLPKIDASMELELILANHRPQDALKPSAVLVSTGIQIDSGATGTSIRKKDRRYPAPEDIACRKLGFGSGNSAWFFLGYGNGFKAQRGTDRFDFVDPFFRITRFHALFRPQAAITDPLASLTRLHDRAVIAGRYPAKRRLGRLCDLFYRWPGPLELGLPFPRSFP